MTNKTTAHWKQERCCSILRRLRTVGHSQPGILLITDHRLRLGHGVKDEGLGKKILYMLKCNNTGYLRRTLRRPEYSSLNI